MITTCSAAQLQCCNGPGKALLGCHGGSTATHRCCHHSSHLQWQNLQQQCGSSASMNSNVTSMLAANSSTSCDANVCAAQGNYLPDTVASHHSSICMHCGLSMHTRAREHDNSEKEHSLCHTTHFCVQACIWMPLPQYALTS